MANVVYRTATIMNRRTQGENAQSEADFVMSKLKELATAENVLDLLRIKQDNCMKRLATPATSNSGPLLIYSVFLLVYFVSCLFMIFIISSSVHPIVL
jgi:hypothetical protein